MLQALKNQLKTLAEDPRDPFAANIRKRVGTVEAVHYTKPLRSLILVMPELIAQIRAWMEQPALPPRLKRLHGFLLSYLYHPTDFLPEDSVGLFGYLDDAYLVGSVYTRTMQQLDHRTRRTLPNLADLSGQMATWLDLARRFLPTETQQIDHLLDEIVAGRSEAFRHLMSKT